MPHLRQPTIIRMNSNLQSHQCRIPLRSKCGGFSLVEILAVIAIIVIVLGLGNLQFSPPRPIHAARMAAETVNGARAEAIAAGKRTRVAICVDPVGGAYNLRQLVALIESDTSGSEEEWIISSIKSFPDGTGLFASYSDVTPNMRLNTVGRLQHQTGNDGFLYVFVEFDALGECQSSSQWVFTRAEFDSSNPVIQQELDRDGFILRKTGKLAWFHSPEQIQKPIPF